MLILNLKAFVVILVGAGISLGLSWSGYLDATPALMLMGLIFLVMDLGIRRPKEPKDLFSLKEGAHLFFIPMWIIGIVVMVGYAFFW